MGGGGEDRPGRIHKRRGILLNNRPRLWSLNNTSICAVSRLSGGSDMNDDDKTITDAPLIVLLNGFPQ
jgi:hypothetical protein